MNTQTVIEVFNALCKTHNLESVELCEHENALEAYTTDGDHFYGYLFQADSLEELSEILSGQSDYEIAVELCREWEEFDADIKRHEEQNPFGPAARNSLAMKFYKAMGDHELYSNTPSFKVCPVTRVVSGEVAGVSFEITTLDEGIDQNEWAMNGRKNWRAMKRFTDWVRTGEWMGVANARWEAEEASLKGSDDEDEVEVLVEANPKVGALKSILEQMEELLEEQRERWERFEERLRSGGVDSGGLNRLMQIVGAKSESDLKRAYREFMMANHPDRNPNADLALVQEVASLMDTHKRKQRG